MSKEDGNLRELTAGLAGQLGLTLEELISNRRGVQVWKCRNKNGWYILKYSGLVLEAAENSSAGRASLVREIEVLASVTPFGCSEIVNYANDSECVWILERFIKGSTAGEAAHQIHKCNNTSIFRQISLSKLFLKMTTSVLGLHQAGFLHADLQPSNFLVSDSGEVTLVDFGQARRPDGDWSSYRGGLVHYNAPEIAQDILAGKQTIAATVRSDIYSLGVSFYFLCSEKLPIGYDFHRLSYSEVLEQIIVGKIRTFEELGCAEYSKLENIIGCCIQKELAVRPSGLQEVVNMFADLFQELQE